MDAESYTGQKCGFWVQIFAQPPSSYAASGTFGSPSCIWCLRDNVCLDQSVCVYVYVCVWEVIQLFWEVFLDTHPKVDSSIFLFCELNCSVAQSGSILFNPWTAAYQAPLSVEFSSQEYWSGLPFPLPGDLPDPGMETVSCTSWVAGGFFTAEPLGKHSLLLYIYVVVSSLITKCQLHGGGGFWSVHCCVLSTG